MTLRLHMTTHDAKAHEGLVVQKGKARNDGVEGPFAGSDTVGMTRLGIKPGASVLKANAGAGHHDPGAKTAEVRLNKGHHHAGRIGGREIDRIGARAQRGWWALDLVEPDCLRGLSQGFWIHKR